MKTSSMKKKLMHIENTGKFNQALGLTWFPRDGTL